MLLEEAEAARNTQEGMGTASAGAETRPDSCATSGLHSPTTIRDNIGTAQAPTGPFLERDRLLDTGKKGS